MKRLAIALFLLSNTLAGPVQAAFHGREISRRPDMANMDMVDTVSWYSEESVRLAVEPWRAGRHLDIPAGATAAWVVCDEGGTNWIVRYDSAPTTNCTFWLGAGEGALPAGHDYAGYVSLLDGTNILGVVDRHNVSVFGQPADGGHDISPEGGAWGGLLMRMAEAEGAIATNASAVASNTAAIAELAAATNALHGGIAAVDERVDGLWAECAGGWHWPDYFLVDFVTPGAGNTVFTNAVESVETNCNVVVASGHQSVYKGWSIESSIFRQSDFDEQIAWGDGGAEEAGRLPLEYGNGLVTWPADTDFDALDELGDAELAALVDREVTGRMGNYVCRTNISWPQDGSARGGSSWSVFAGPAPGTLLADLWDEVLGVASNRAASPWGKSLRRWPNGYGTPAGVAWNTNFFAYGVADFSCVSFWVAGSYPAGVYKPITMVTPRHGIVANHWKPNKGTNVLWLGRGGEILTNRVVAYRNLGGDLTVARLERAFSTNEVLPALLLNQQYRNFLCGSTNVPGYYRQGNAGTWGVPVIPFDCAERGGVAWWKPRCLGYGDMEQEEAGDFYSVTEDNSLPQWKAKAVGGDSGSPTFVLVPGAGAPVLLGCFHYAVGGPMPMVEAVNDGIALWGDEERASSIDFGNLGYQNYNTNGLPPVP